MKNYYIADLHFAHANIIRHCNRPFPDVETMDQTLINNWNEVVTDNDTVYILGDFCFTRKVPPNIYLNQLKGKKILIAGNHDQAILERGTYPGFDQIHDYLMIQDVIRNTRYRVALFHYPMVEWDGYFKNSIHLYGHIHNNTDNDAYKHMKSVKNAYNVGADILDFRPRTLDEVIRYNKKFFAQN
ncbi:MAG: metallophosphoesterase [Lachnospiraceae bacterium]|nr:metallophosphoesterase [Lachnospiraceae bacterium]